MTSCTHLSTVKGARLFHRHCNFYTHVTRLTHKILGRPALSQLKT